MGFQEFVALVLLSWSLCSIQSTHQLQVSDTQILLQIRKHLEFPPSMDVWGNHTSDICSIPSTPGLSLTCEYNSVTELKVMGDKNIKVSTFHGYAIPNRTLSESFSIDSLVTTLTRLTSLRVLSLVSLGIWGSLPDKIHRLNSLQLLDLSSNYLFGSVPGQISRLGNLQILSLDGNFLNGSVPHGLDTLSNLTVFTIKDNRLVGQFPSSISRTKTITNIALSNNQLSGKLPDLSGLSSLHVLDLIDNKFDSQLPVLPIGLVTLLLSRNSFSGEIPNQVGELNQLQHLDLSFNSLSGAPPSVVFSLPNISYLDLASNMLSGSIAENLHCGAKLGFVDISDNKLTGELPSCLGTATSDKTVVKYSWNCLSIDTKHQHQESFCNSRETSKNNGFLGGRLRILTAVIGGAVLVMVVLLLVLVYFCRRAYSRRNIEQPYNFPKVVQDNNGLSGVSSEFLANARFISEASKIGAQGGPHHRLFSMEELKEATNNFHSSTLIGDASIGKLYKGRLESGTYITIRSLALKKCSIHNLRIRLDWLSKLHHPNLVGLLGHCIDAEDSTAKVFLVYEFIPNGSYHAHLSESNLEKVLKWPDRLAVLISVAKAVHFLHTGVIPGSFNNRLKTNNILLDEHHIAKLSDYGMSILTDEIVKLEGKGEALKSSKKTNIEDDVYNFGFVLLESLVGPIVTGKGETFLLNEMASFGSQDGRRRIVDPIVLTTSSQESLRIVISITNKCISPDPSNRPSFEDVLWNLQYAAQVQGSADADQRSDATSQS